MNISESTGFATLIVTIITSVFFPFIQRPAINYQVDDEAQNGVAVNRYKIDILNYGPITAHNVIVSLRYSNGNIQSFVSEPYLSTGYTKDNATGSNDTAFAKIGVLPPFGSVTIHVDVDGPLQPAARMLESVYVSSDEAIGRETSMTILVIIVMVCFVIGASIAVYLLWRKFLSPHGVQAIPRRHHISSVRSVLTRPFRYRGRGTKVR
jgi:hypothetical protein